MLPYDKVAKPWSWKVYDALHSCAEEIVNRKRDDTTAGGTFYIAKRSIVNLFECKHAERSPYIG